MLAEMLEPLGDDRAKGQPGWVVTSAGGHHQDSSDVALLISECKKVPGDRRSSASAQRIAHTLGVVER